MKIIITEGSRERIALKWLNKEFGNLTRVDKHDRIYYIDKNRFPLFYHHSYGMRGNVYVSYSRIWTFFESIFGMGTSQTKEILKVWLEETYGLTNLFPHKGRLGLVPLDVAQ